MESTIVNTEIRSNINKIKEQIVTKYASVKIVLFGFRAKGTARKGNGIDLCIVINADNKRELLTDMYN